MAPLERGVRAADRPPVWALPAGRQRGISIWSPQLLRICCTVVVLADGMTTRHAAEGTGRGVVRPDVASVSTGRGLRWATGGLFVLSAVAFAAAAMVLSSTFNWPDILREPASVVLPAFVGGGTSLVWTWFATAWAYAILAVPILLLPAVLGRRDDPALRAATYVGATSVVLSLIGFLRWVFVVPAAGPLLCQRRCQHPGSGGRRVDRPAPIRRCAAR